MIAAPGATVASLSAVSQQIVTLRSAVSSVKQTIVALQNDRQKLTDEAEAVSIPKEWTKEQRDAFDLQKTAVSDALAKPITKADNDAARIELATLKKLVEDTNEQVKAAKQPYNAVVPPILKRLTALTKDFERLKVTNAGGLTPLNAHRDLIAAASKDANWPEAIRLAGELDDMLKAEEKTAAELAAFRDAKDSKLLQNTYDKILMNWPAATPFTIANIKRRLDEIYEKQCEVSRLNWIQFLGIAGENMKEDADVNDHFTTFNNSFLKGGNSATVNQNLDALLAELFESVAETSQAHSTFVVDGERYHRYWSGGYSYNVTRDNLSATNKRAYDRLNSRWNRMKTIMTDLVKEAQAKHGRIGTNTQGPEV